MEFDFDLENPFSTSIHDFPLLFQRENDHAPSKSYLQTAKSNPSTRSHILSLILYLCRNFDAFSSYLAINYMDRFLSTSSIPEEKPWIWKLVAVSCISLALKMRKIEFSVSDIQDDGGLILDPVTIERTEMLILGALKWRMRSVNPFSFISFFVPFFGIDDETLIATLKERAGEIILRAQNAALLVAANELFPTQLIRFRDSVSSCEYVNEVELFRCYDLMQHGASRTAAKRPYDLIDSQCCSSSISENKQTRGPKRRGFGAVVN